MSSLVLALLALAVGPILWTVGKRSQPLLELLDGFALVALCGLLLAHALPHAYGRAGWAVLPLMLVGLMLPTLLERWLQRGAAAAAHGTTLLLAMAGLALHATLDGAALRQPGEALAMAVVLHRLPVGLTIWMLLRPARPSLAYVALAMLAVATVLGYGAGGALLSGSPRVVGLFEALVIGALLHVVLHAPHHPQGSQRWRLAAGTGALVALALLLWVSGSDTMQGGGGHAHGASAAEAFLAMARESAVPLLLAYLGASLLHGFLPRASIDWLGRGPEVVQALRGMAFGLPLPICSCGVVPLYRGLIERGAPAAAALAFLVATPEIGVDAVLLSLPLLGTQLTVARVLAAALVAIVVGWSIGRLVGAPRPALDEGAGRSAVTLADRLVEGLRAGFGGLVDNTAAWILLGLGIAAVGARLLDPAALRALPAGTDVVVMAVLGIPTYVCASGATPLVAMLVAKGLSPGAALAFLLTGPATNITTFGILSSLHGHRVALSFGLLVGGLAIAIGYGTNGLLGGLPARSLAHGHTSGSWLEQAALIALAALYAASVLRQGPRHFVAHAFKGATHGHDSGDYDRCGDDHDHGDGHDHDHDDHDHDDHDHHDHDHHGERPPADDGCCGCSRGGH